MLAAVAMPPPPVAVYIVNNHKMPGSGGEGFGTIDFWVRGCSEELTVQRRDPGAVARAGRACGHSGVDVAV